MDLKALIVRIIDDLNAARQWLDATPAQTTAVLAAKIKVTELSMRAEILKNQVALDELNPSLNNAPVRLKSLDGIQAEFDEVQRENREIFDQFAADRARQNRRTLWPFWK